MNSHEGIDRYRLQRLANESCEISTRGQMADRFIGTRACLLKGLKTHEATYDCAGHSLRVLQCHVGGGGERVTYVPSHDTTRLPLSYRWKNPPEAK